MSKILQNIRDLNSAHISWEKVFGLPREARITNVFCEISWQASWQIKSNSEFLRKQIKKIKDIQNF